MTQQHPRIAIIGDGTVGSALRAWFESRNAPVASYDPARGFSDAACLAAADIVFVCVPTPYDAVAGFDAGHVLDAVQCIPGRKLVVVKSTVLPGTTDALAARFSQHRFVFNPEFVREATAVEDMRSPDRQVVGFTEGSENDARGLVALLPPAPATIVCRARDAEYAKYAANAFLAVKVSFANETYDLCNRVGVDYAVAREIIAADPRIGPSHLDVFEGGYRGYGGKCLPKDSCTLLHLASRVGCELRVLAAAHAVNAQLTAAGASRTASPVEGGAEAACRPEIAPEAARDPSARVRVA